MFQTRRSGAVALVLAGGLILSGCTYRSAEAAAPTAAAATISPVAPASRTARIIRSTGVVQAVRSYTVRVPQISQLSQTSGQNMRLTLTALVPNGTPVKKGDILVEFDPTAQIDDAREAKAKLVDLQHQLEEKRALANSESSKRMALIREAEAELGKAQLQLKRGPVLPALEKQKAEVKAASAQERLDSLNISHKFRLDAETASVRVLELKNDRQQVVVERLQMNLEKLTIRAPHDGMTALESVWRSGSMGPSQVGDQVWPNQPIVRVFDPTEMIIETQINEPDMVALGIRSPAKVFIDAYPSAAFEAHLESASPVATAGLESPVKSFTARFRILQRDNRILPDLSGSLEIAVGAGGQA